MSLVIWRNLKTTKLITKEKYPTLIPSKEEAIMVDSECILQNAKAIHSHCEKNLT